MDRLSPCQTRIMTQVKSTFACRKLCVSKKDLQQIIHNGLSSSKCKKISSAPQRSSLLWQVGAHSRQAVHQSIYYFRLSTSFYAGGGLFGWLRRSFVTFNTALDVDAGTRALNCTLYGTVCTM